VIESATVGLILYKQKDEEFISRDDTTVNEVSYLPRQAKEAPRLGPNLKLHVEVGSRQTNDGDGTEQLREIDIVVF
jgi:uncharacterized protein involved in high-affinity Fe2+ transport